MLTHLCVEQKHILEGVQKSTRYCPVALAIKDTLANMGHEDVDVSVCAPCSRINGVQHFHPEHVRAWIVTFDLTGKGEPFTFEFLGT